VIEASAHVVSVHGDRARVVIERQTACGGCAGKTGCGTRFLAEWLPQRQLSFDLDNRIGARVGERVVVGIDEARFQRYAVMLYALPVFGLLAGAVFGQTLFPFLGLSAELGSVLAGLLGVAAALSWVWRRSRGVKTDNSGVRLLGKAPADAWPGLRELGSPVQLQRRSR
jgi:sigma-E factor negative regulatory protein RseC